jgi:hypothetical protein
MFTLLNATDTICSTILVIAFAIFAYFYCKLINKTNKKKESLDNNSYADNKTLHDRVLDKMKEAQKKGYAGVALFSGDALREGQNGLEFEDKFIATIIDLVSKNDGNYKHYDELSIRPQLVKRIHLLGFLNEIDVSRIKYEYENEKEGKGFFKMIDMKYYNKDGKEINL